MSLEGRSEVGMALVCQGSISPCPEDLSPWSAGAFSQHSMDAFCVFDPDRVLVKVVGQPPPSGCLGISTLTLVFCNLFGFLSILFLRFHTSVRTRGVCLSLTVSLSGGLQLGDMSVWSLLTRSGYFRTRVFPYSWKVAIFL